MSKHAINQDEMIGYIIRKANENNYMLDYDAIIYVLAYYRDFCKEKDLFNSDIRKVDKDRMNEWLKNNIDE